MIPNSLSTRGVIFAYLFGPPRFVTREEASRLHGLVCDALGMDDLSFRYGATGAPGDAANRGFSITLEHAEGAGSWKVEVDNPNPRTPIRLLMTYVWPPSLEDARQRLDLTARALFDGFAGDWTRVMAEVRLRAQCHVRGSDALGWLRGNLVAAPAAWVESLGSPLAFASMRFEVEATPPEQDPMEGARRDLVLEVLREDRRCLYLEVMSHWPQVAAMEAGRPLDLGAVRVIDGRPSVYVDEAYAWLRGKVEGLAAATGSQETPGSSGGAQGPPGSPAGGPLGTDPRPEPPERSGGNG